MTSYFVTNPREVCEPERGTPARRRTRAHLAAVCVLSEATTPLLFVRAHVRSSDTIECTFDKTTQAPRTVKHFTGLCGMVLTPGIQYS